MSLFISKDIIVSLHGLPVSFFLKADLFLLICVFQVLYSTTYPSFGVTIVVLQQMKQVLLRTFDGLHIKYGKFRGKSSIYNGKTANNSYKVSSLHPTASI